MTEFETFQLWVGKTSVSPTFAQSDIQIQDSNTIRLVYCRPTDFSKRRTDTSNAQAANNTSPDTVTAGAFVELQITQSRESDISSTDVLKLLIKMFYTKMNADGFLKARIGLVTTDNPALNLSPPSDLAGYKIISFKQTPNQEDIALQTFTILLQFIGDHLQLEAFS